MNNYKLTSYIASGTFGKVYKGYDIRSNELIVIKKILITNLRDYDLENIFNEVKITSNLECDFIVKSTDVFTDKTYVYIVFPYYKNGNLKEYLMKRDKLLESEIWKIITQLLIAIDYLNEYSIIHRDIKIMNILVKDNGDICLADFGVSKILSHKNENAQTQVGTPYYFSPELVKGIKYSYNVDIWALGVIIYEIIYKKYPFEAHNLPYLVRKIKNDPIFFPDINEYSYELLSLCKKMLSKISSIRPTSSALLNNNNVLNVINSNNYKKYSYNRNIDKNIHDIRYDKNMSIQKNIEKLIKIDISSSEEFIYKKNHRSIGIQVKISTQFDMPYK